MSLDHVYDGMPVRSIKNQKPYTVVNICKHSETGELMVNYKKEYGGTVEFWVRPYNLFLEKFEKRGIL